MAGFEAERDWVRSVVEKVVLASQERVEWDGGQARSRQSSEEEVTGIQAKAGGSLD